jgi:hypothetical protein
VAELHAFGDSIIPQVAAEFIGAYMDTQREDERESNG